MLMRQEGIEPPTRSLEGCCSIQLSYWRCDFRASLIGRGGIRQPFAGVRVPPTDQTLKVKRFRPVSPLRGPVRLAPRLSNSHF
jgi:hypothetical protein